MTGQKTWAIGEEVLAADFNNYVQTQVVAQFATVAARDTWSSPPNGALAVTLDTNTIWQRVAGAWVNLADATRPRYGIQWQRAAAQSIPNASFTTITFDVQSFPAAGTPWGAVGATATVPTGGGGMYDITFEANFAVAAIGADSFAQIVAGGHVYTVAGVGGSNVGNIAAAASSVPLANGQTIQCRVLQTSGAAVNCTGFLFATRTGPVT